MELSKEERKKQKVLEVFFNEEGRIDQLPVKLSKKKIIFEKILEDFEKDKKYPEKEVNEIIERYFDDYCTVRRYFIELGMMTRKDGIYIKSSY
ncbi:MAG: transcriptional regulator [Candidatus Muiribacterium halophilum]|uniref:Transcriptional regulator n=1 Tax=Muiribacterium halophilum TaxID=2053465 RepID=A0A2N5Z9M9_MUIH1|nr:MAG: transcriptional regulator [Candidatus Muirbacterium halophilum]